MSESKNKNTSFDYDAITTNIINLCQIHNVYLILYSDCYLVLVYKNKYYCINYIDFCSGKRNHFVPLKTATELIKNKCEHDETILLMELSMISRFTNYKYRLAHLYKYIEKIINYIIKIEIANN